MPATSTRAFQDRVAELLAEFNKPPYTLSTTEAVGVLTRATWILLQVEREVREQEEEEQG